MKTYKDVILASGRLGTAVRTSGDPVAIQKARLDLHMVRLEIAIQKALSDGVKPGSIGHLAKKVAAATAEANV